MNIHKKSKKIELLWYLAEQDLMSIRLVAECINEIAKRTYGISVEGKNKKQLIEAISNYDREIIWEAIDEIFPDEEDLEPEYDPEEDGSSNVKYIFEEE